MCYNSPSSDRAALVRRAVTERQGAESRIPLRHHRFERTRAPSRFLRDQRARDNNDDLIVSHAADEVSPRALPSSQRMPGRSADTLALHKKNAAAAANVVRGLSAADLAKSGKVLADTRR